MNDSALIEFDAGSAVLVGAAMLVFLMQAGFCLLESGIVRSKNAVHVAAKNLVDICVASTVFALVGYQLAFGASLGGWIGLPGTLWSGATSSQDYSFAFYQLMFCGAAATIVSGAVTERIRARAYLFATIVIAVFLYPPVVHWVWATDAEGAAAGWLARMGFIDFAGSTVVHGVGAWCALALVLQLGPRRGRFQAGKTEALAAPNSNLVHSTVGVMLLWFGWFGFNGGSAYNQLPLVPLVLINTFLAGVSGATVIVVWQQTFDGKLRLRFLFCGLVGGLVSVTASCHLLEPSAAMVTGALGGASAAGAARLFERLRVDDPVDVIACHGVAGLVGTLSLAALAAAEALPMGRLAQVGVQLFGAATVFAFSFGGMTIAGMLWSRVGTLRVTAVDEHIGLSVAEHGVRSEFADLFMFARYADDDSESGAAGWSPTDEFSEYGALREAVSHLVADSKRQRVELQDLVEETREGAVELLVNLCEFRDTETAAHIRRIQLMSSVIASHLSASAPQEVQNEIDRAFLADLRRASVLHDIGKIGIPDEVLLKPGLLTPEERQVMQGHTTIGAEILSKSRSSLGSDGGFIYMAIEVARSHHERYDGSGYPDGLAGEDIPLAARIVAVADVFDALASKRIYKRSMPLLEARMMILEETGRHFDPEVVAAFLAGFDEIAQIHRRYVDGTPAEDKVTPVEVVPSAV